MAGIIHSRDFLLSGGVIGWRIDGDGNAIFNSGTFRGTLEVGSGINKAFIDPSGTMFGDPSATAFTFENNGAYDGFYLTYAGVVKAFLGRHVASGDITFDLGGGTSAVQNVHTIGGSLLRAFSTSDPRTIDAPLYTAGGAWIEKTCDVRGNLYVAQSLGVSDHIEVAGGNSSAPAYAISGDSNTGLFSDEADKLKASAGGSTIWRAVRDAGGNLYMIMYNGVAFRFGNTSQAITSETLSHFVTAQDDAGNTIKLAIVS